MSCRSNLGRLSQQLRPLRLRPVQFKRLRGVMNQMLQLETLTTLCLQRPPSLDGAALKIYWMDQCLLQMRFTLEILKAKDQLYRLLTAAQEAAPEEFLCDFQLECQLHARLKLDAA